MMDSACPNDSLEVWFLSPLSREDPRSGGECYRQKKLIVPIPKMITELYNLVGNQTLNNLEKTPSP